MTAASQPTPQSDSEPRASEHPAEYRTWGNMKQRCYNENIPAYRNYGGRGITVCDEWLHDFKQFFKDMGEKPSSKHSIDRVDNDKGYSPDNCRWATSTTQSRNTRVNKRNRVGQNGVRWKQSHNRWEARISVAGMVTLIGSYATKEEAIAARKAAEKTYWEGDKGYELARLHKLGDMTSVGVNNPRAKVTEQDVFEIREASEHGVPAMKLADKYGLSYRSVRDIICGVTWKHLEHQPNTKQPNEEAPNA